MTAFDVCGELPTGTTVLEASAGTGKTYTIAALAARYIADGIVELPELMVITFGRMATNELRMRVRERLVAVERALTECLAEGDDQQRAPDRDHDDVTRLLITGTPSVLAARHRRVRAALAEFDAATIATTHEFCQTMLDELGVLGDHEPDATFTDSLTDLTAEVATDCYLQRFAGDSTPPPFDFAEAIRIATDVIGDETVPLVPRPVGEVGRTDADQRYAFATDVREQLRVRKARRRLYSYSDMLTRLRDTLVDPVRGGPAADRLRERYAVVLVDEFQDTDPVQWEILRTAFAGHATLILIGDPKQAIYAFRGADVYSYLDAVTEAGQLGTLNVNWRSDSVLVAALDQLMGGVALGDQRITVGGVTAHHQQRRLLPSQDQLDDCPATSDGGPGRLAPVRIRFQPHEPESEQLPRVGNLRRTITADLVADIAELLAARPLLTIGERRPVRPGDIAVLVRRNDRAEEIRTALTGAGIPAVVLGVSSVYASDTASEWLTLLTALEQPRQSQVRAVALTAFVGWTMPELATADEDAVIELSARIRRWSRLLTHRGVAALIEAITTETDLGRRMLASIGGERRLTDIRHIGQSLHATMTSGQLGVGALIDWLRQRIDEAQNTSLDDRSRRLETDAEAVQILTVHRSKGLQFPIVYLPEAWDRFVRREDDGRLLRLHDDRTGELVLDVGGLGGAGRRERLAGYRAEDGGEDLRLAYVAFTRAQTQVVTWWMPSLNTAGSALQRFLFRSRAAESAEPADRYEVTSDPGLLPHDAALFSIEQIMPRPVAEWQAGPQLPRRLESRRFDRELDQDWRRTSYSALTAAAHGSEAAAAGAGAGVSSEAEPTKEDDETAVSESLSELATPIAESSSTVEAPVPAAGELVSPMDALPMGAAFGTVVHAIFEQVDPQADDLGTQLRTLAGEELSRLPAGPMTAPALADGIEPALLTPLGPLADDRRLADIPVSDRLAELTFELPLAGGDQPRGNVRLGDVGPLLDKHLDSTDHLAPYPAMLADPMLADQPLRGYLTGSIDAVLRVGDDQPRYLVVDYKTNWLGEFDRRPLLVSAYAPSRLPEAMMRAHYPLQALLYAVALHRYLRWRQPGYDPEQHLGGMLYLFVRGMAGPDTPREGGVPCGVFSWRPPSALITELSDLLDGVERP
ncbi:UvrD-helicase domain-containing protein [Microlunatus soli]|uniref:RecBCD enzyme subunit RecB n=1 Tax=Microlunatus soli TaxID=630515 RepID=A0A1H1MPI0_9ACTN|nr:UvrD-helicase domain-containing protein [Microlunatus soli]SDR88668.1 exodeoxyribonuclease V beta subunit [Microlunatus soli]